LYYLLLNNVAAQINAFFTSVNYGCGKLNRSGCFKFMSGLTAAATVTTGVALAAVAAAAVVAALDATFAVAVLTVTVTTVFLNSCSC
jgi:hypothetical protein